MSKLKTFNYEVKSREHLKLIQTDEALRLSAAPSLIKSALLTTNQRNHPDGVKVEYTVE